MFTLKLEHFRGWKNIAISFPENKVTLIHGPSGIGKTTLFEAIEWMLYGKLRGPEPLLGGGNPSVMLEGPKWAIQRLSSSNVRFYDKETDTYYVDSDAQRYIEFKFHGPKIWKPCCYIKQKRFNSFLEGSNAEKMAFLNALAFHGEDPATYYAKLDARIQQLKLESQQAQEQFNFANGRYSALAPGVETTNAKEKEVRWRELGQIIPEAERNNLTQTRLEERKATLQRQLLTLQPPVAPPPLPFFDVSVCEKNITRFLRYQQVQRELTQLPIDDSPIASYTPQELEEVCRLEANIRHDKQTLGRFNIPYDVNLGAYIQRLKLFLEGETENKRLHQLVRDRDLRKNELASLSPLQPPLPIEEPSAPTPVDNSAKQEERNTLQRRSEELRQTLGKNFLRCPHCSKTSHYLNGALLSADNIDVPSLQQEQDAAQQRLAILQRELQQEQQRQQQEMQDYTRKIQTYTSYMHQQQRYTEEKARQDLRRQKLEDELRVLSKEDISSVVLQPLEKYARVRAAYDVVCNITYYPDPAVTSQQMQQAMRQQQEREKRNADRIRLQVELESFSPPPTDERDLLNTHRRLQEEERLYQQQLQTHERQQRQMQQEIESIIVPVFTDLEPLRRERDELQRELRENHAFLQKKEAYAAAEPLYHKNEGLRATLQRQYRLRQVMNDVECQNLQGKVVNTVNDAVSRVCGPIFKDSIHIELRLFKDQKSGMKPGVNFLVSYKGGTLNDLERLSGGEKDRASLALSLAFNSRSSFPLLLLDECFASLNDELKEATVESLRAQLNTTMLVIMHDGVQGIYDHDINLADYL
jgi:DNA repair exonuclease SbcCD ATPase subunit